MASLCPQKAKTNNYRVHKLLRELRVKRYARVKNELIFQAWS